MILDERGTVRLEIPMSLDGKHAAIPESAEVPLGRTRFALKMQPYGGDGGRALNDVILTLVIQQTVLVPLSLSQMIQVMALKGSTAKSSLFLNE